MHIPFSCSICVTVHYSESIYASFFCTHLNKQMCRCKCVHLFFPEGFTWPCRGKISWNCYTLPRTFLLHRTHNWCWLEGPGCLQLAGLSASIRLSDRLSYLLKESTHFLLDFLYWHTYSHCQMWCIHIRNYAVNVIVHRELWKLQVQGLVAT